jgi:hypothetical protein
MDKILHLEEVLIDMCFVLKPFDLFKLVIFFY